MAHELSSFLAYPDQEFFVTYLGETINNELRASANPLGMPENQRTLLRALLTTLGQAIPQADHVIRRDVRSEFDMYVGYNSPGGRQRGHYIDICAHRTGFVLSIGGSPDPARRDAIAREHECTAALSRLEVMDLLTLQHARDLITQIASIYNPLIAQQKNGVRGWTPATCRAADNVECSASGARQNVSAYCLAHRHEFTPEKWKALCAERDRILVPAVMQGLSPAQALEQLHVAVSRQLSTQSLK